MLARLLVDADQLEVDLLGLVIGKGTLDYLHEALMGAIVVLQVHECHPQVQLLLCTFVSNLRDVHGFMRK